VCCPSCRSAFPNANRFHLKLAGSEAHHDEASKDKDLRQDHPKGEGSTYTKSGSITASVMASI